MNLKKLFTVWLLLLASSVFAQTTNSDAIIYADQYPGTSYQDIIDHACPNEGCTIYANNVNASHTLGTIDPKSKAVTLYLGPYIYNLDHFVMRKGLKIIGMGASDTGTQLQSTNNNFPLFKLPGPSDPLDVKGDKIASDVYLYGFRMLAFAGNTFQVAMYLDAVSVPCNTGVWHSTFEDLYLQGFMGAGFIFSGTATIPNSSCNPGANQFPGINQFLSLRNIWATRPPGGGPNLRIEGFNGQIDCIECHMDGWGQGAVPTNPADGWANIFIGNLSGGNQTPYSIHFVNLTSQGAATGVQIQGARHVTFIGSHHEALQNGYLLSDEGTVSNTDILIENAFFAGNVASGSGFILSANNAAGVTLSTPLIDAPGPPPIVTGTSAANVNVISPYWNLSPTHKQLASSIAGDLTVNGRITKSAGSFTIDHPLDPRNKKLSHSFVESPDMKNIYDGIATLDKNGEAIIRLPDWFQALNRDFRYQVTCIGTPAPVYIAQEIRNNTFKIAGGHAGSRISWQVTGTRHDAYANANRITVEEKKIK